MITQIILFCILAYVIGSIPFALIVGKVFYNTDIRTLGSGNLGTTNTFRCLGKKAGVTVFICDVSKGIVATFLPTLMLGRVDYLSIFGAFAMIGHVFPIFANFKGGKAVATGSGVFIFLYPMLSLLLLAIFFSTLFLTGYVSLGSILISLTAIGYLGFFEAGIDKWVMIVMCIFVIYMHISGTELAKKLRGEIKAEATVLREKGVEPTLAVVLVGDNKASRSYVNSKHKACLENSINSIKIELSEEISTDDLLTEIEKLNKDEKVHGILVQLPLPKHIDAEKVLNAVIPSKDVDGFHPINVGKLVIGEAKLIPCTPLGILEMIKSTGEDISGKLALVIGRSNIVGKPISTLLLQNNATVITAHSRTKDLEALIEQADIIVSCVGVAHFLSGKEKVKPTCTIIDVGNNYKDGKLVGDVNLDEFMEKVAYISPVPGGVGPLTITMLMRNTLTATYDLLDENK